jgi:hypothetical protein
MGFFGKLFGGGQDLPELDPASPGAKRIAAQLPALETFVKKLHDPVEMIPAERSIYAFIGRPPDRFGIAWFPGDGTEHNLKTLVKAKGLSVLQQNTLSKHLREAYEKHQAEPRFGITIAGKKVKVIPSAGLEADLTKVIHEID